MGAVSGPAAPPSFHVIMHAAPIRIVPSLLGRCPMPKPVQQVQESPFDDPMWPFTFRPGPDKDWLAECDWTVDVPELRGYATDLLSCVTAWTRPRRITSSSPGGPEGVITSHGTSAYQRRPGACQGLAAGVANVSAQELRAEVSGPAAQPTLLQFPTASAPLRADGPAPARSVCQPNPAGTHPLLKTEFAGLDLLAHRSDWIKIRFMPNL